MTRSKIGQFFKTQNTKVRDEVITTKCIYCKKVVRTINYPPICSRSSCRKQFPRKSHDGTQEYISYDDKMIRENLIRDSQRGMI